jgi:hypothetical protein
MDLKKMISLVCLLSLIVGISGGGCTDELVKLQEQEGVDGRLELRIPGADVVSVYSTATVNENRIADCFVVTFSSGGAFKNAVKINDTDIYNNGMATALLPLLPFELASGDKVYVICNTGLAAVPAGIASENDLNTKFKPAKNYYFGGEALPMSGSVVWSALSSSVVTLVRTVAKVQVALGETFNVGGFSFDDFDFLQFNERNCGFVVANYAAKSDMLQNPSALSQNLTGLSAFYGATSENRFLRFVQHTAHEDTMTVYISEFPNSVKDCEGNTIPDNAYNEKRLFLLMLDRVGANGLAGNGDTVNCWRLDFYDAATNKYLDIKRNHHYLFTINKIRSAPYVCPLSPTPGSINTIFSGNQEVWHNPGSNIEYVVECRDIWANNVYSNGQYAIAFNMDTIDDANDVFMLKAFVPTGVDYTKITTHTIEMYDRINQPLGFNGSALEATGLTFSSAGMASYLADGTISTLTFTVNDMEYLDSAQMLIKLGNIRKYVPIRLNPWIYMPDAGFRAYCTEKGFIAEVRSDDPRYVRLSAAGKAAQTINMQRTTPGMSSCINPNELSDINTSLYSIVYDLTGIEAFTNLRSLFVSGNNISEIDVSKNKKLVSLVAFDNPSLLSVNLKGNRELRNLFLDYSGPQIDTVDISYCSPSICIVTGHMDVLRQTAAQSPNLTIIRNTIEIVPSPYSSQVSSGLKPEPVIIQRNKDNGLIIRGVELSDEVLQDLSRRFPEQRLLR